MLLLVSNDVAWELVRETESGDGGRVGSEASVDADAEGDGDGFGPDEGKGGGEGRCSAGADVPRDWLDRDNARDFEDVDGVSLSTWGESCRARSFPFLSFSLFSFLSFPPPLLDVSFRARLGLRRRTEELVLVRPGRSCSRP